MKAAAHYSSRARARAIVDANVYRQVGLFVARILKGEKPPELPVQRGWNITAFVQLIA